MTFESRIKNLCFISLVLLATSFIVTRSIARTGTEGDAAVFIRTQAAWAAGQTLYDGVFEMKDFGFFALNAPFFRLLGVPGLALAGLVWTSIFCLALYMTSRLLLTARASVLLALAMTSLWVMGPWFLPLYTETLSIAVFSLGVALLNQKYSFAAGLALGTAIATKIVLLIPVLILVLTLAAYSVSSKLKPDDSRGSKPSFCLLSARVVLGLVTGVGCFLTLAFLLNSLRGWVEVFRTNRLYQSQATIGIFDFAGVDTLLVTLSSNRLFIVSIAFTIVSFLAVSSTKRGRQLVAVHIFPLLTLTVAVLGVAWSAKIQNASGHHSQPVLAAGFMLACFTIALSWKFLASGQSKIRFAWYVAYATAAIFVASWAYYSGYAVFSNPAQDIERIRTPAPVDSYLLGTTNGKSVDLVFTSNPKFYFIAAKNLKLSCRFTGSHPISLLTHRDEVEECARNPADLVVFQDYRVFGDWLGYREFWDKQRAYLRHNYGICRSFDNDVVVFAKAGVLCPGSLVF